MASQNFAGYLQKLRDNGTLENISRSAKDLCEEKHLSLTALKIEMSDAGVGYGVSFRRSTCVTQDSLQEFYPFATIFKKGIAELSKILNDFEYVPEGESEKRMLENLLSYLTDTDCLDFIDTFHKKPLTNGTQLAEALAEHLFSRLTDSGYVVDNHWDEIICNCGCEKILLDKKANTSIGHAAVWNGYLDLIVSDGDIPIKVHRSTCHPSDRTLVEKHEEEHTLDDIDSVSTRQEIVSQTIVFSFLQRKRHPNLNNFLIPCIGVSFTELIFFFYDCEHDVLLKTLPMPFHNEDGSLNYQLVVALWLVLNYKYSGTGLSERLHLAPKANFFEEAKDYVHVYRHNLSQGNVNLSFSPVRVNPSRHSQAKFVKYSEFTFPGFT